MFANILKYWLLRSGILGVLLSPAYALSATTLETVTLQLRWSHQFQFAGYYAALHKGYYRQQGLDVTIRAGTPSLRPVDEVLAGRAQYGEANSELLMHYLNGAPLIALAAIVQHSPSVLLTRADSGIRSPQDLSDKKIMMMGGTEDVDFLAMFANEGMNINELNILPSSYNIQDLIDRKVDAFNAYLTNEPFFLSQKGIVPYAIKPLNYGIDFYSDILFTTQQELKSHPDRVKRFREASLQGWAYALEHPDEIIDLLIKEYQVTKSRKHLEYEAKTLKELILPELVPIGNINPGRFTKMAQSLEKFDFVRSPNDLNGFVYDPDPRIDPATFWQTILSSLAIIALLLAIIFRFWQNANKLKREIDLRRQTEISLKHSEHSLKRSQLHFKQIIDNLQDVYYRSDENGRLVQISPSGERFFKTAKENLLGKKVSDFYAPPYSREQFLQDLANNLGVISDYEIKLYDSQKTPHWISVNSQYYYENDKIAGIEGTFRDISEQKERQKAMLDLAFEDPLTGLPNRRALISTLEKSIANSKRHETKGAILFIDLDGFKPVNDTYGHSIGDQLLQQVSERLKTLLRAEDSIFRIGGDEFIVLLPELEHTMFLKADDNAIAVAEKVVSALNKPFNVHQIALEISCSLGICGFPDDGYDADTIIKHADNAMYEAKTKGKNQAVLYRPEKKVEKRLN